MRQYPLPDFSKLTPEEIAILNGLGAIAGKIADLPRLHEADFGEAVRDIHDLQNRILARAAYPMDCRVVHKAKAVAE